MIHEAIKNAAPQASLLNSLKSLSDVVYRMGGMLKLHNLLVEERKGKCSKIPQMSGKDENRI